MLVHNLEMEYDVNLVTLGCLSHGPGQGIAWDSGYKHGAFLGERGGQPSLCLAAWPCTPVACIKIKRFC